MTSPDQEFASRLKEHLDRSAGDLRPGLAYRLQQARAAALGQLEEKRQTAVAGGLVGAHGLAGGLGTGTLGGGPRRPLQHRIALGLGIAILAAAMFGWYQWKAWQEVEELSDIDAQILTSDLPIDAYVDRGFQNWLSTAQRTD